MSGVLVVVVVAVLAGALAIAMVPNVPAAVSAVAARSIFLIVSLSELTAAPHVPPDTVMLPAPTYR
ncbi:hypothetical protein GCM10008024_19470 [Allgaiera indica]|uniref:Uncharacterized protein n=1 Tax=Allgaiera indica TaxID=765699 RepID=A0AAN4ZZC4_9RHOB|nr:hypothetical protein GCM10008024_19470 [Allgaiera indica]